MTDTERLILEKLDALTKDIKEVKVLAIEAKEEATLAKEEAIKAREIAELAREEAQLARQEATLARQEAAKAREIAELARKEAGLAREIASKIQLTLENEIDRKINIIGEGHDFLKTRLNDAVQMELKRESMELEIVSLRYEVKKIKEHLNIA